MGLSVQSQNVPENGEGMIAGLREGQRADGASGAPAAPTFILQRRRLKAPLDPMRLLRPLVAAIKQQPPGQSLPARRPRDKPHDALVLPPEPAAVTLTQ